MVFNIPSLVGGWVVVVGNYYITRRRAEAKTNCVTCAG